MERSKRGVILLVCGILLLLAAAGWTLANTLIDRQAGEDSAKYMEEITQQMKENQRAAAAPEEAEPVFTVDGDRFCGYVVIDKIDIELPVFSDWDYNRLLEAPCRYTGSVETGDLIVVAHNYKTHFGNLKTLVPGDEAVFYDAAGKKYEYAVSELVILDGTAVEEMQAGDWDFTLFTCTVGGKQRVTVRFTLKEEL